MRVLQRSAFDMRKYMLTLNAHSDTQHGNNNRNRSIKRFLGTPPKIG